MIREIFLREMSRLEMCYLKFKIVHDEVKLEMWFKIFEGEDEILFVKAIENFILTSKFVPTIAGIRDSMMAVAILDVPTAELEFEKIMEIIRIFPRGEMRSNAFDELGIVTKRAVKCIGGIEGLARSTTPLIAKNQFVKSFNEMTSVPINKVKNSLTVSDGIRKNIMELEIKYDKNNKFLT